MSGYSARSDRLQRGTDGGARGKRTDAVTKSREISEEKSQDAHHICSVYYRCHNADNTDRCKIMMLVSFYAR